MTLSDPLMKLSLLDVHREAGRDSDWLAEAAGRFTPWIFCRACHGDCGDCFNGTRPSVEDDEIGGEGGPC
jgi:hypothetical protein